MHWFAKPAWVARFIAGSNPAPSVGRTMTTEQEEHYALIRARQFLVDLMDPKKTPRVPKYVREEARARVKHFPIVNGYLAKHGPHDHDHLEEQ